MRTRVVVVMNIFFQEVSLRLTKCNFSYAKRIEAGSINCIRGKDFLYAVNHNLLTIARAWSVL